MKRIVIISILTCMLLTSVAMGCTPLETPPAPPLEIAEAPSTPIDVELSISRAPVVGAVAKLTCTVSSTRDAPNTTAHIKLPEEAELVSGSLNWQGDLLADEPVSFPAKIVFREPGKVAIEATARHVIDQDNSWGGIDVIYLTIGVDHSEFGWPPSGGRVSIRRVDGPPMPVVDLSIAHPPLLKETVEVICTVSSEIDSPNIEARIILPRGAILVDGNLEWQGDLEAGVPVPFLAKIRFQKPGIWCIDSYVHYWLDEESSVRINYSIYLIVDLGRSAFVGPPKEDLSDLPPPPALTSDGSIQYHR